MADIFISYSKTSRAHTEQLASDLRGKGFTVWYDTGLIAGDNFRDVITSELAQARAAIVIWTAESVKSDWVCSEASRARARRILIPVRVDGVRSHDIPPPFDGLHTELLSNRAGIVAALANLGVVPNRAGSGTPPARPASADVARPAPTVPHKASIAILPLRNMGGEPEQEYFGDGIAEDVITMLSRSPSLFVIARNSSFAYKDRTVDVKQIAHELGVRYVLEGSVRRGGNRVRITAQLINAETGNHLWAERYDGDPSDIFAVQDEITEAVTIAIEPTVVATERRRAVQKPPESLSAWEAYQRGRWHGGHISAEENEAAKSWFRQAIDRDPNFAPAHAGLAFAILQGAYVYQKTTLAEVADEALAQARKAIALNPLDAIPHACLGHVLIIRGDLEGALAQLRKALSISPNFAGAYHLLGVALIYSGEPREGIEAIRKAIRLDPHDPGPLRWFQIAHGHYFLREYEAAADAAKQAIRAHPDHALAYRWLAAALGQPATSQATSAIGGNSGRYMLNPSSSHFDPKE